VADRVKSWDDLKSLRQKAQADSVGSADEWVVVVGTATCGAAAGAGKAMAVFNEGIKNDGLKNVKLIETGCYGNCYAEPVVEVRRGDAAPGSGVRYGKVDAERAKEIFERHIKKGEVINEYLTGQDQEVYIP
jgi:(2Fe-2S) ferredoxin